MAPHHTREPPLHHSATVELTHPLSHLGSCKDIAKKVLLSSHAEKNKMDYEALVVRLRNKMGDKRFPLHLSLVIEWIGPDPRSSHIATHLTALRGRESIPTIQKGH